MGFKLCVMLLLSMLKFHSIHISYSKAEVSERAVHFKVSYYKDDLLKAIDTWYKGKAASLSGAALQQAETEYLKNHVRFWAGKGFSHPLTLASYTLTADGTSVIFEATYSSDIVITMLSVDHRVICEDYSDQMNILTLKAFGKDHNIISTAAKPTTTISNS